MFAAIDVSEATFKKNYKPVKKIRSRVTISVGSCKNKLRTKANTDKDVMIGDIVSFYSGGELLYGTVVAIKNACYPSTILEITEAYYDATNKNRVAYENAAPSEESIPAQYKKDISKEVDKLIKVDVRFYKTKGYFYTRVPLKYGDEVFTGEEDKLGVGRVYKVYEPYPNENPEPQYLNILKAYTFVAECGDNCLGPITSLTRIENKGEKETYIILARKEGMSNLYERVAIKTELVLEHGDIVCFEKGRSGKPFYGIVVYKGEITIKEEETFDDFYDRTNTPYEYYTSKRGDNFFIGQEIFAFKGDGDPSGYFAYLYLKDHEIDFSDKRGFKALPILEEKDIEKEEEFFDVINSTYESPRIFFMKRVYSSKTDYQTNQLEFYLDERTDTSSYYTTRRIKPGDLAICYKALYIITHVALPRNDRGYVSPYEKDFVYFRGNGDLDGKQVIKEYFKTRERLTKQYSRKEFLDSKNVINAIDNDTAETKLPDGSNYKFKITRSLDDIKEKINKYKPAMLSLLVDKENNYHDSHFASTQYIEEAKRLHPEYSNFDGSFVSLLSWLEKFVNLWGRSEEYKKDYNYPKSIGSDDYTKRKMESTHFRGVNILKNFAAEPGYIFKNPPYFINADNISDAFIDSELNGLTIYVHAYNPNSVKYYNQAEYSEAYGFYSTGGWWDLEKKVVESYAVLCLNDLPPVFNKEFYDRNIIFEINGKFYAYYVYRDFAEGYVRPDEIYNDPAAYYLCKDFDIYGYNHKLGSLYYDGAFASECYEFDDNLNKALFYLIDDELNLPEVNEHFYKDKTGIYSRDGKILYFAFGKNIKDYVVKSGVEEIRSYAFAYLKRVESITIPMTVKKIGRLSEPESKSKKPLCPKLKTLHIPYELATKSVIVDCFCGCNISKKELKGITIIEE